MVNCPCQFYCQILTRFYFGFLSVFLRVPLIFTVNDCLELHGDFFDGVLNIGGILHFEHRRLHVAKLLQMGKSVGSDSFSVF